MQTPCCRLDTAASSSSDGLLLLLLACVAASLGCDAPCMLAREQKSSQ